MKTVYLTIQTTLLLMCVSGTYFSAEHKIFWLALLIFNIFVTYVGLKRGEVI